MPTATCRSSAAHKDIIISGGLNIYPKEIEDGYLDEIDGVAESAVIGVPHTDFGEAVTRGSGGLRGRRRANGRGILNEVDEGASRRLQSAQAHLVRRRFAAQCDGQGAEKRVA